RKTLLDVDFDESVALKAVKPQIIPPPAKDADDSVAIIENSVSSRVVDAGKGILPTQTAKSKYNQTLISVTINIYRNSSKRSPQKQTGKWSRPDEANHSDEAHRSDETHYNTRIEVGYYADNIFIVHGQITNQTVQLQRYRGMDKCKFGIYLKPVWVAQPHF
ncbi:hypothetical protein BGX27_002840, partial [Mortierella sp. AM989]